MHDQRIGERAGNAALEELVMVMHTRPDRYPQILNIDTTRIAPISRLVYSILGVNAPINKAVVGQNAFAHEAGIHQHGVMANRATYEIMTPESIGLRQNQMVLGKHSGHHASRSGWIRWGIPCPKRSSSSSMRQFKALCDRKKLITDKDLEALALHRHAQSSMPSNYKLERFTVNSGNYTTSNAVVTVSHNGERTEEVALGDGPIDAAFNAVDKLIPAPEHSLEDYASRRFPKARTRRARRLLKSAAANRWLRGAACPPIFWKPAFLPISMA